MGDDLIHECVGPHDATEEGAVAPSMFAADHGVEILGVEHGGDGDQAVGLREIGPSRHEPPGEAGDVVDVIPGRHPVSDHEHPARSSSRHVFDIGPIPMMHGNDLAPLGLDGRVLGARGRNLKEQEQGDRSRRNRSIVASAGSSTREGGRSPPLVASDSVFDPPVSRSSDACGRVHRRFARRDPARAGRVGPSFGLRSESSSLAMDGVFPEVFSSIHLPEGLSSHSGHPK